DFLTRSASGNPHAQYFAIIFAFAFPESWQKSSFQFAKHPVVAKKMRNINEQIIEERVDLFLVVAKEFRVMTQLLYPMQGHAPMNAAKQGCLLIAAEIDASLFSDRKKYARHVIGLRINCFLGCRALTIDRG